MNEIKFVNLKRYLENNGWIFESVDDKFIEIHKMFDEKIELLISNDESLPDYTYRMKDTIQTIAELENVNFDELFNLIKNYDTEFKFSGKNIRFILHNGYNPPRNGGGVCMNQAILARMNAPLIKWVEFEKLLELMREYNKFINKNDTIARVNTNNFILRINQIVAVNGEKYD